MLDQIRNACLVTGAYTLSIGTMNPGLVLSRLLDALAVLDPETHRSITAPDATYASIPAAALEDMHHPCWGEDRVGVLMASVIEAINVAAPKGFACVFSEGDRIELVRIPTEPEAVRATPRAPPPSVSAVRHRTSSRNVVDD